MHPLFHSVEPGGGERPRWPEPRPRRYNKGDNRLGACPRLATPLARRMHSMVGRRGGPPEKTATAAPQHRQTTAAQQIWASRYVGGRSRVRAPSDRQRTVLYDRLAWTIRSESNPPWDGGTALVGTAIRTRSVVPAHRDPSPGVFRTPVAREVGQHWGMSRLKSRRSMAGVHFLQPVWRASHT